MFTKEFTKENILKLIQTTKGRIALVAIAVSLVIPLVLSDNYMLQILTLIVIFTIYASSWNLLASSGQGSLGHAAFLGIGGFTSSLLAINLGIPPIIGIFIGGALSAAVGFVIGVTCVRLKAWFLAMVTFGFSVIAETLFSEFDDVTHAILGFRTPPLLFSSRLPFYYFALLISIASVAVIYFIMKSKIGLAFRAIHQNATEASMIGINTAKYKLYAFVLSTFFAGLSGAIYTHFQRYIHVTIFAADNSFKPLMMSVIGGLGTIEGPIIGSALMVFIDHFMVNIDPVLNTALSPLFPAVSNVGPSIRLLGLGIFLVVVVVFLPKGISSLLPKIRDYFLEEPKKAKKK
jgi:branched-chain amino acid transport system permease protein